jgi:hypothetical protein
LSEITAQFASLCVIGRGEATASEPELFDPKARATVRYADPASWITAAAIVKAMTPIRAMVMDHAHDVGVIVISDEGPTETIAAVAKAALEGQSSPLRYPAANPGAMAGVTCIALGFRGPTINLIMPPADGVVAGLIMCDGWLKRGMARIMVQATFCDQGPPSRRARAVLLATAQNAGKNAEPMTPGLARWLMQTDH